MSKHFDELSALLSHLQCKFSVIGISETRFLKNRDPILDFSIPGYNHVSIPMESSAGGVLLYISDSFAFKPRPDLSQRLYLVKTLNQCLLKLLYPIRPTLLLVPSIDTLVCRLNISIQIFSNPFFTQLTLKISKLFYWETST